MLHSGYLKICISPEWIYPVAKQTENNKLTNLTININSQYIQHDEVGNTWNHTAQNNLCWGRCRRLYFWVTFSYRQVINKTEKNMRCSTNTSTQGLHHQASISKIIHRVTVTQFQCQLTFAAILINAFHCDIAEKRFVGKLVIIQTFS